MNCTKCGTADFYESIFGGFDCRNPDCEYGTAKPKAPETPKEKAPETLGGLLALMDAEGRRIAEEEPGKEWFRIGKAHHREAHATETPKGSSGT